MLVVKLARQSFRIDANDILSQAQAESFIGNAIEPAPLPSLAENSSRHVHVAEAETAGRNQSRPHQGAVHGVNLPRGLDWACFSFSIRKNAVKESVLVVLFRGL